MELTTNNLIKMTIAVLVIVLIITGIFIGMRSYIIPYFSGIGFEEPKIDINTQFGNDLVKPENLIAITKEDSDHEYLWIDNKETLWYFEDGDIMQVETRLGYDDLKWDSEVGFIGNEGKLEVVSGTKHYDWLKGSYKYGFEIYKMGGNK
jgi:hypothetical protein